jgi:hypothetical protein
MQMKSTVTMTVLSAVLLSASMISPVFAAATKPAKMTCEEFVMLDNTVKPNVVYWAEGFNQKGKPVDAVVDIDATDKLVPVLVDECQKTPKASFWRKVKQHL